MKKLLLTLLLSALVAGPALAADATGDTGTSKKSGTTATTHKKRRATTRRRTMKKAPEANPAAGDKGTGR